MDQPWEEEWTSVPFDDSVAWQNNELLNASHERYNYDNVVLKQSTTPPKQVSPLSSPAYEDVPLSVLLRDLKIKMTPPKKTPPRARVAAAVKNVGARYVRVSNLPTSLSPKQLTDYFMNKSSFGAVRDVLCDHLADQASCTLAFHDVREAATAAEYLRYERGFGTALDTECLTREELLQTTSMAHHILSESEGQVQIDVLTLTASTSPSAQLVQAALVSSIQSDVVRDVAAFSIEQADHTHLRACCTFFDDRVALAAVIRLQGADLFGCRFTVSLKTLLLPQSHPTQSALLAEDLSNFVNPFKAPVHPPISMHNTPNVTSPRIGRHAVPKDNVVDLEAIELGLDTRTSIMLKNLPNRMTDQRLYEIVSEATPRSFDFLYLRLDFDTGSSVGYAFVNFLTPKDVVRFGRARLGTRWDPTQSEKQVYMSYANIQGKEALIDKFRNSDVMTKTMSYRPKIFHSSGPLVGLPEEFPPPDETGFTLAKSMGMPFYPPPPMPMPFSGHGFISNLYQIR